MESSKDQEETVLAYFKIISLLQKPRGSVVVKVLCYKPEDRGFDTL
jgi:hypothetical protein